MILCTDIYLYNVKVTSDELFLPAKSNMNAENYAVTNAWDAEYL